jgi:bifunctional DNA-binding transcriptional regulator/antitoxin component of YhaV-PrlF toxin-antitoxin module
MAIARFKLPIGAKCQVTIPKRCMGLLSLAVGDDLLLEVKEDHAVLHPMISVPRHELPEELWKKFAARRGARPTDIPLKTLLDEVGYRAPKAPKRIVQVAGESVRRGGSTSTVVGKGRAAGDRQTAVSRMDAKA